MVKLKYLFLKNGNHKIRGFLRKQYESCLERVTRMVPSPQKAICVSGAFYVSPTCSLRREVWTHWAVEQCSRLGLRMILEKSPARSTSIQRQSLMSWDSDILASVFLTRKAVSLEAGLWAQHSVISFPICLRHWRRKEHWRDVRRMFSR